MGGVCKPDCLWRRQGRLRLEAGGGGAGFWWPGAYPPKRSSLGEEFSLACWSQTGHLAVVRRRTGWRDVLRWRPDALVAQEALDAFWVTDESAQFRAARPPWNRFAGGIPPAGRTLVQGQTERQTQELGPSDVAAPSARRCRLGRLGERRWPVGARGRRRGGSACGRLGRGRRNDEGTPMSGGRKHTAIAGQMLFRPYGAASEPIGKLNASLGAPVGRDVA